MVEFDLLADYSQKHSLLLKRLSNPFCLRLRPWRILLPAVGMWGGGFVGGSLCMVVGRIKPNNQLKMVGRSGKIGK